MVIWKYVLELAAEQWVNVPKDAAVLSLGVQREEIVVWVECDPTSEKELRKFYIAGTGSAPPDSDVGRFVGTVQIQSFVAHVFEGQSVPSSASVAEVHG